MKILLVIVTRIAEGCDSVLAASSTYGGWLEPNCHRTFGTTVFLVRSGDAFLVHLAFSD